MLCNNLHSADVYLSARCPRSNRGKGAIRVWKRCIIHFCRNFTELPAFDPKGTKSRRQMWGIPNQRLLDSLSPHFLLSPRVLNKRSVFLPRSHHPNFRLSKTKCGPFLSIPPSNHFSRNIFPLSDVSQIGVGGGGTEKKGGGGGRNI